MITYQYTQKDWTTFKEGIKREWAVTNGIGGYAGSSMIGAHSRTGVPDCQPPCTN